MLKKAVFMGTRSRSGRSHRLLPWLAWLCLLPWVWPASGDVTRFAYAVNGYDSTVLIYQVQADTGALSPVGHVPVKKFPGSAVTHPNGRWLFVSTQTGMSIHVFTIDPVTGRLTEIAGSPFDPKVVSPFWLTVAPQGDYLFIAGRNSNAIAAMAIDPKSGALTSMAGSPFTGGFMPRSVTVDPTGQHVYMVSINDDSVTTYTIDRRKKTLVPLATGIATAGDAPQFMAIDPAGRHAYVSSWTTKSLVSFKVTPETGILQPDLEYGLGEGISPFGVTMTPDGRYLYVASWWAGIVGFRRDEAKDHLVSLPGSPYATFGVQPIQIYVEPEGNFAYVTNYGNNTLTQYRINSDDGSLIPGDTILARSGPRAMAFVTGKTPVRYVPRNIFALRADARQLVSFALNTDTAKINELAAVATGAEPVSLAVDPLNQFVFVANKGADSVGVFSVDAHGGLKEMAGSPYKTGSKPVAVRVDYNGRFVYVINEGSNNMSVYMLLRDSGRLEEAPNTQYFSASPYAVGEQPGDLLLHTTDRYSYVLNRGSHNIHFFKFYGNGPLVIDSDAYGSPFALAADVFALAREYTGKYMYTLDSAGNVGAFTLDLHNGTPAAITDGGAKLDPGATGLRAHPRMPWLYVTQGRDNTVRRFNIDPATGRLQKAKTIKLSVTPQGIEFDQSGQFAVLRQAGKTSLGVYRVAPKTGDLTRVDQVDAGVISDLGFLVETR